MALNKADSISQINNLLPDNTSGEITPVDQRLVSTNAIDSNLNVVETIAQVVAGLTNFTGGLQLDGVPVTVPTKETKINAFDDLPAPSGGVITLVADMQYTFENNIDIGTNRIILNNNTVVNGLDEHVVSITYTGTGDMFTSVNATCRLKNIGIFCVNGTVVNASDTGPLTTNFFFMFNVIVWQCANVGSFTDLNLVSIDTVRFDNITNNGMAFTGTFGNLVVNFILGIVDSGIFIDLGTATFNGVDIVQFAIISASGTTAISGATSSANIAAGGLGNIRFGKFLGDGTALNGISAEDALWEFLGNDDIADTRPDGLLSQTANATATVITTIDTPVLLAGTWDIIRTSQFTGTAAGRLTYNGGKPVTIPVTVATTAASAIGVNKDVRFYIGLNGVVIGGSRVKTNLSAGDTKNQPVIWQLVMQPNDYIEVFVENATDTVDIIVEDAKIRIN